MYKNYVSIFYFPISVVWNITSPPCLVGERFNEKRNSCVECELGYFGIQCNIPCVYPGYGKYCQLNCDCEKSECNIISGCIKTTTGHETSKETESEWFTTPTKKGIYWTFNTSIQSDTSKSISSPTDVTDDEETSFSTKYLLLIPIIVSIFVFFLFIMRMCLKRQFKYSAENHNQYAHYEEIRHINPSDITVT
ncbi:uncharacterized protein LOC133177314 [Saccostrea echinata]|uniref:uncharacterized protein LOC133177314 n=1 Tax=Saccostrea echinata TaxID=191078 RepID=UPI002A7EF274|nr:uncharacterized protein LOC133177314 [Saccostrea echinata]